MSEPTIYNVLMDTATTDLFQLLERRLDRVLGEFRLAFLADYEDAVRKAYVRGVQDGFVQGVGHIDRGEETGNG